MMKEALGLTNEELYDVFAEWNRGELDSYLIEITRDIFTVKDKDGDGYLVDKIMDKAGAKGTGKWMSQLALDHGVPSTLVTEAVYARCLSAMKDGSRPGQQSAQRPLGQVHRRQEEVHRADSPRALRFEDLQLRPRLRADASRSRGIQLAAQLRRLCDALARRLHHPGEVPRSHQGSVRRRSEAREPAARAVLRQGRVPTPKTPGGMSSRRPPSSAFRCRRSRPPSPTTTATAAIACRQTCCKPNAITSAHTPTSASTSPARSTPIGFANER